MGWVLLDKATGKPIEYQSHSTPGVLTQNNIQYGHSPDSVEEKQITDTEWAVLDKKWNIDPSLSKQLTIQSIQKAKTAAVQKKLGLNDQEFQDLKDSLRG